MKKADLLKIKKAAAAHKDETVKLLQQLIRIPSVNRPPTGDEKKVQQFYFDYLRSIGLHAEIYEPANLPQFKNHPGRYKEHNMKNRPNVVGILKGSGRGKSLMLIAHADTELPCDKKLWTDKNPFSGAVRSGRIFGRGSGDDKSGMAIGAIVAQILRTAKIKLKGDLIIASVSDEEQGGGNGTVALLAKGYKADASIYLDGCNNDICISNLGGGFCNITFTVPKLENLQLKNCFTRFKKVIEQFTQMRRKTLAKHPQYNSRHYLSGCSRIMNISLGSKSPTSGSFKTWFCLLPEDNPEKFKKEFEKCLLPLKNFCSYQTKWMSRFLPASQVPKNHPFVTCFKKSFELTANQPAIITGSNMCDMGFVNKFGRFPCLLFGPIRMAKKGAFHYPNEFIEIKELMKCLMAVTVCAMNWCGYSIEKD